MHNKEKSNGKTVKDQDNQETRKKEKNPSVKFQAWKCMNEEKPTEKNAWGREETGLRFFSG